MRNQAHNRLRAFLLCLAVLFSSVGLTVFGPASPAHAWTMGDDYPSKWKDVAQDSVIDDWRQYNRECTSWVAWTLHSRNGFEMPWVNGTSGAADWGYADRSGYGADSTPAVGSVAWWDYGDGTGHVAWVAAVNGTKVTIEEYNANWNGKYSTRTINASAPKGYIHFKDLGSTPMPNDPAKPEVLAVKRTTDPGGVRQVYAATKSAVTEAWWVPGGNGTHSSEIVHIAQNNIVGFDKVNLPNGRQSVYTAVPDGIWETWWGPGEGLHSSQIVTGMTGVRQVIADNRYESGQFVHRLYVLAADGPHEIWWKDGGDGIHNDLLDSIAGPVTMTSSTGPDGAYQLYVATPTHVYELWWFPGGGTHHGTIMHISQGDIRSLSKGDNLLDGGQLLYTGTSTTAWQSYWLNGPLYHGTIAQSQVNAIQIKKAVTGGVHQLYLATGDHVQEYWWNGPNSGTSTLIDIAQNNIKAFDKSTDGADQQVYTGSGDLVYETWWRNGVAPTSYVLFKVAR